MSMIDGVATLEISSPEHPAVYVTTVLGIEPDWSAEKGDLRPRQGDTGSEPIRRRVYDTSMWVLEVDSNPGTKMAVDDDDAKGFATLQVLVDRLFGRGPLLAQLKQNYKVELTWYGTAGASQAGFMLPSSLLAAVGELGLDVMCTVYAHDDTSERPGLHVQQAQLSPLLAGLVGADDQSGKPARVEKTPEQLAAEQLLADSFIAEQLFEQSARDRENQ
ncbi:MAG TPA: hypothetical protein VHZ81_06450 [Galbitalea sp.]|jgi:hypothetical protein|nr:hypothetical protein [Galbitalea sp.]